MPELTDEWMERELKCGRIRAVCDDEIMGYYITQEGLIVSVIGGVPHEVKTAPGKWGYGTVALRTVSKAWKQVIVPEILLKSFEIKPSGDKCALTCLDGNPENLRLENWAWTEPNSSVYRRGQAKHKTRRLQPEALPKQSEQGNDIADEIVSVLKTLGPFLAFVPESRDAFDIKGDVVVETNKSTTLHSVLRKQDFAKLKSAYERLPFGVLQAISENKEK